MSGILVKSVIAAYVDRNLKDRLKWIERLAARRPR